MWNENYFISETYCIYIISLRRVVFIMATRISLDRDATSLFDNYRPASLFTLLAPHRSINLSLVSTERWQEAAAASCVN